MCNSDTPSGDSKCPIAMPFPKAKKGSPALKRSMDNTLNASYQNRQAVSKMWSTAASCPLFLKKATKKPYRMSNGRMSPKYRNNRALSTHTIKAMASGAAANASALIEREARMLRCDTVAETPKYPMQPSVTRSAAGLYEQAVISYCQTLFAHSVALKDSFTKSKPGAPGEKVSKFSRVSVRSTQAGADTVNSRVSNATGFVPPVINVTIKEESKKPKKKAAEEGAAAAP